MNCLSCDHTCDINDDGFICVDCREKHFIDKYGNKWKPKLKIDSSGTKRWRLNGGLHKEGGPAVEYTDGAKYWYLNNKLHRENGPAIEYASGTKAWYINDKRHRADGPAIEYVNGDKHWHLNGNLLSEQAWNKAKCNHK